MLQPGYRQTGWGKALDTFGLDHNKWPELAADRLAWRAMLRSGEPPPYYRAPPPTPAALPIALTRPKRPMAATNAAIQNSMQQLAATTRLGVKKNVSTTTEYVFPDQTPTQTVSLILPRACTPKTVLAGRPYVPC